MVQSTQRSDSRIRCYASPWKSQVVAGRTHGGVQGTQYLKKLLTPRSGQTLKYASP